jgi:hypothetical protein
VPLRVVAAPPCPPRHLQQLIVWQQRDALVCAAREGADDGGARGHVYASSQRACACVSCRGVWAWLSSVRVSQGQLPSHVRAFPATAATRHCTCSKHELEQAALEAALHHGLPGWQAARVVRGDAPRERRHQLGAHTLGRVVTVVVYHHSCVCWVWSVDERIHRVSGETKQRCAPGSHSGFKGSELHAPYANTDQPLTGGAAPRR